MQASIETIISDGEKMSRTVIYSSKDPAGTGIAKSMEDSTSWDIAKTDSGLLYCEKDLEKISTDFIAFASKHKSESGSPVFTVHVPGNWNAADMGGKPAQVSKSDPLMMKSIAVALESSRKKAGIDISVGLEVDHHGPLSMTPCCFVEIGSTEKEWSNSRYAAIVAEAIEHSIESKDEMEVKEIAFCIGGGHYCPAFNKMEIEGNVAISHILPNYAVDAVTLETFMRAFERTTEEIDIVLIDWKGLKAPQRERMMKFINDAGAEWRRE